MTQDIGKLILRLMLGILLIMHGLYKISHGVGFIETLLTNHGLPAWIAYGAYIGEFVCPILVIVGLYTRPAAIIIAFNMLMAIFLTQAGALISRGGNGGLSLELEYFYLFTAVAIALIGAGRYSLRSPYN